MNRFLCREPLKTGSEVVLAKEQSHHLTKVLRLKENDSIELFDGNGTLASATIKEVSPKKVLVGVTKVEVFKQNQRITLAFGMCKNQALDFIIHRVTEVGVRAFQPLITAHSQTKKVWNSARWQRVVGEVAKQCQSLYLPILHEPCDLESFLNNDDLGTLVLCNELDRQNLMGDIPISHATLLVGSEGGWSQSEIGVIKSKGAFSMGLGSQRLRAETACLSALVLLKKKLGEI